MKDAKSAAPCDRVMPPHVVLELLQLAAHRLDALAADVGELDDHGAIFLEVVLVTALIERIERTFAAVALDVLRDQGRALS